MKRKMTTDQLLKVLKSENIHTWFDLGLFIDRFKEENEAKGLNFNGDYGSFVKDNAKGGAAFITFHYMVDGVTVEIGKYAELIRRNIPNIPISRKIALQVRMKMDPWQRLKKKIDRTAYCFK